MALNKPVLLIFTDWYAPGYKAGGPITSIVNLVKLLKNHYKLYVITSSLDLGVTEPYPNTTLNAWLTGANQEEIYYSSAKGFQRKQLNNIIEAINPKYIYFNSLFSVSYFILPLIYYSGNAKLFLSPRGMLHHKAFSQKHLKKTVFITVLKLLKSFKKLSFIATDQAEKAFIETAGFKNPIHVLSNAPDLDFFNLPVAPLSPSFITVSRIAEEKNSIKAIEAMSLITQNISFTWVGEAIDANYKALFQKAVSALPPNIGFKHLGALDKSLVKQEVEKACFFFLPTLGENFGHAIFEALAASKPSIIGEKTPFVDLEKASGGYVINPINTLLQAAKINALLSIDEKEYKNMAKNATLFASKLLAKSGLLDKYKTVWP